MRSKISVASSQGASRHRQSDGHSVFGGQASFAKDFVPADLIVRRQSQPGNEMMLSLPLSHVPSRFADNRHRGYYINAVDLSQVRTAHAKQLCTQVALWLIAFLLPEPYFAFLFR